MKYLKYLALFLALLMVLTFTVACNSGDDTEGETSADGTGASTEAPFVVTLSIIALDEEGEEVDVLEEEEAQYNGLKATNALTVFDIIEDYCMDNEIEYTAETDDSGYTRIISIAEYSIADGGYMWTIQLDGKKLTDYDKVIPSGAEIVVTMVTVG